MNKKKRRERRTFWLFLAPALIAFLSVQIIPFAMGIYYSFTDWTATYQPRINWVGLDNYRKILTDASFVHSAYITSIYTLASVVLVNLLGFGLALLVTSKIKAKNFCRAAFFLPNVIGGIILGYIWQFMFNNLFPSIATFLGFDPVLILSDASGSLLALIIVNAWQYAGYIMMIYVAALQNVPSELLEAAKIDGANAWTRFVNITIPMIMPAFTITLFLTLTNSFKQFDVNISLTGVGPATFFMGKIVNGTELLAQNISNTSLVLRDTAFAQSKAIIFFLVLVVFSIIQVAITSRKEVEL